MTRWNRSTAGRCMAIQHSTRSRAASAPLSGNPPSPGRPAGPPPWARRVLGRSRHRGRSGPAPASGRRGAGHRSGPGASPAPAKCRGRSRRRPRRPACRRPVRPGRPHPRIEAGHWRTSSAGARPSRAATRAARSFPTPASIQPAARVSALSRSAGDSSVGRRAASRAAPGALAATTPAMSSGCEPWRTSHRVARSASRRMGSSMSICVAAGTRLSSSSTPRHSASSPKISQAAAWARARSVRRRRSPRSAGG